MSQRKLHVIKLSILLLITHCVWASQPKDEYNFWEWMDDTIKQRIPKLEDHRDETIDSTVFWNNDKSKKSPVYQRCQHFNEKFHEKFNNSISHIHFEVPNTNQTYISYQYLKLLLKGHTTPQVATVEIRLTDNRYKFINCVSVNRDWLTQEEKKLNLYLTSTMNIAKKAH